MESGLETLSIESRHKRERKELLAKILNLKKSAGNDKKKKKEALEQTVRLEAELNQRHDAELAESNQSEPQQLDAEENEETPIQNGNEPRVTKAQKRRDKKAAEEKVRQAEIRAAEEENKNGPRVQEMSAIQKLLAQRNLALHTVASDGDCLYNAIRNQLRIVGGEVPDVATLRQRTADYILQNKESLIFYMTSPETGDCLTDEEFSKYCDAVRSTPAWGGQVEITALATILKSTVEVIQSSGPPTIQGNSGGPNLIITYHRHMYSLGEHYNGTRPLVN